MLRLLNRFQNEDIGCDKSANVKIAPPILVLRRLKCLPVGWVPSGVGIPESVRRALMISPLAPPRCAFGDGIHPSRSSSIGVLHP